MVGSPHRISLVIPNYNGIRYLERLLPAVRAQDRVPDQVVLVDDASTDDSVCWLQEHAPDWDLVVLEQNLGFVGAVNAGIDRATGSLIGLLNNDTEPDPNWLGALERELEAHPDVGSVASRMLFSEPPHRVNSVGIGCTDYGMVYDVGYGCDNGPDFDAPREVFGASAGAALYRRSMLDKIGHLDPALVMWYEDVDLAFRAQLYGYRCRYVPDAVVYHVGGGTVAHRSPRSNYYCARNQLLVWLKNLPADLLPQLLPGALWLFFKHSLKMLITKGDTVPLRGYAAGLWNVPHVIRERRRLQPNRAITSDALRKLFVTREVADAQIRLP